ncbi:hypothetical protein DNO_0270 [Dichelobacter nodosus VCS1703A]|uniref:Uncharacterized protein n=2 Tax=Dichelobacter nodosus TaxID=870 RepID=A5EWA9_DICNV|nr:hypothetical protein DNO_0270 [Dichelobacter nodosus VCS1703A]
MDLSLVTFKKIRGNACYNTAKSRSYKAMENKDIEDINAIYERCKDTDFSRAKKVCEIPELQKFQEHLRAQKTHQNALNAVIRALFT